MSQPIKNMTKCEFCGKSIEVVSPPLNEYYEAGQIEIKKGTILLPEKTIKAHHKDGISDSHCKDIDGYYCHIYCLIRKLKEILGPVLDTS